MSSEPGLLDSYARVKRRLLYVYERIDDIFGNKPQYQERMKEAVTGWAEHVLTLKQYPSEDTILTYMTHILYLFEYMAREDIPLEMTDAQANKFRISLPRTRSAQSRSESIYAARSLYRYMVINGDLTRTPFELTKGIDVVRGTPKPLTKEEYSYIYETMFSVPTRQGISNKRFLGFFTQERELLIMLVLMNSGLRQHELLKLKAGDLSMTEDRILKITIRGKGGVERTSPVVDIFGLFKNQVVPAYNIELDSIGIYLYHKLGAGQVSDNQPLFNWASRHTLYWMMWLINHYDFEVNKKGVVYDFTPHRFRHTYATYLYTKLDFTLEEVKDALGHKSINTTLIYAELDKSKMDAKIIKGEISNGN